VRWFRGCWWLLGGGGGEGFDAAGDGGGDYGGDEDVVVFVFGGEDFGVAVEEADDVCAGLGDAVLAAADAVGEDGGAVFEEF